MINAARIAGRVMKGGHDVPIAKIISRYQKSIINCKVATAIADRVYLYDNSVDGQEARILLRFANGSIIKQYTTDIPQWAKMLM
jgi:predicted ABC-type ATPase